MGLTVNTVEGGAGALSNISAVLADVTFDDAYGVVGEEINPSALGLRDIIAVIPCGIATDANGNGLPVRGWLHSSGSWQLTVHETAAAAEGVLAQVDQNTDLSGYSVRLLVIGA